MSLDLYINTKTKKIKHSGGTGVFVRENGKTVELSKEEVEKRYPQWRSYETSEWEDNEYYHDNITHNLGKMADEVKIKDSDLTLYSLLWRPDEHGMINVSKNYIQLLRTALNDLKSNPNKYKVFNPSNGWGTYENLVQFTESYLNALEKIQENEYGEYIIEASR